MSLRIETKALSLDEEKEFVAPTLQTVGTAAFEKHKVSPLESRVRPRLWIRIAQLEGGNAASQEP